MARCQRPLLQGTHRALVAGRVARSADAATPRVCRSRVRPVGLLDIADDEPLEPLDHRLVLGLLRVVCGRGRDSRRPWSRRVASGILRSG